MKYNRFMGEYDDNTIYQAGDVVNFDGASYYRKVPGKGISPIARKKPYTVWSRLNEALSTIFPLGGTGGGGTGLPSGGEPYMQLVTDGEGKAGWEQRLAWKEKQKVDWEKVIGVNPYPLTIETVEQNGLAYTQAENVFFDPSSIITVIFDGVEYPCEVKFNTDGEAYIGAEWNDWNELPSFDEYPFVIDWNGYVATKNAGTHTLELVAYETVIKYNYLPELRIFAVRDADKKPQLDPGDAEKIVQAYTNGIPVTIGSVSTYADGKVVRVDDSFITVVATGAGGRNLVYQQTIQFLTKDGSFYDSVESFSGNIKENGDNFPVLFINNRRYKISIGDGGTLVATLLT